jgi:hypothetical protein
MNSKVNAILTAAAILLALAGAKAQSSSQRPENANYHIFDGNGKEVLNTNWDGHVYTITRMGGVTTDLCVDNKKIAPADRAKYDSVVTRILKQVEADEAQAAVDRQQAARDREQAVHDQEQAARDREQAERDRRQAAEDRRQAAQDRENLRRLTAVLVEKKLIPDAASLKSLLLTGDELIINGKKADPEIHKEIKGKYGRWAHLGFSYGTDCNCGASIHFHTGANR